MFSFFEGKKLETRRCKKKDKNYSNAKLDDEMGSINSGQIKRYVLTKMSNLKQVIQRFDTELPI